MATLAKFWKFGKKLNSTALPSANLDYEEWYVIIKERSSILNLSLELHNENVKRMNYLYLPLYERYYWVRDAVAIANETYVLNCECDVLGTFGEQVLGQLIYMDYASYGYDTQLVDPRVSPTVGYHGQYVSESLDIFYGKETNAGADTMAVISDSDYTIGGITVIQGWGIAKTFAQKIANTDTLKNLMESIGGADPFSAICGAWVTPFAMEKCHEATGLLTVHLWNESITGHVLQRASVKTHNITLKMPQSKFNDFRKSNDYLQYYLRLPYCGIINIPTEIAVDLTQINIRYAADCISGQIAYNVYGLSKEYGHYEIGNFSSTIRTAIPLASQQTDTARYIDGVKSIIGGAVGGAGIGAVAGGVGAVVGGVLGAVGGTVGAFFKTASQPPNYYNTGSFGGGLASAVGAYRNDVILTMLESDSTVDPSIYTEHSGRPCQRVQQIKKGYCQSSIPSVSFAAKELEIERFNEYLRGGVYFE